MRSTLSFSYKPDWNLTPWIFSQLNGVLEVSKWSPFYSNVMRSVEEFIQRCLFDFSYSFKTSLNSRIGWCFLNNLTRCDGKTSCDNFLVFLLSYRTFMSISSCIVMQWGHFKVINVKLALSISLYFLTAKNFTYHLLFTTNVSYFQPAKPVVWQGCLLWDTLVCLLWETLLFLFSYHFLFPRVFT